MSKYLKFNGYNIKANDSSSFNKGDKVFIFIGIASYKERNLLYEKPIADYLKHIFSTDNIEFDYGIVEGISSTGKIRVRFSKEYSHRLLLDGCFYINPIFLRTEKQMVGDLFHIFAFNSYFYDYAKKLGFVYNEKENTLTYKEEELCITL